MSDARERARMTALAMKELAIGWATFYRLLGRFRAVEVTSAVLPGQAGRKVGSRFLDAPREAIMTLSRLQTAACAETWRKDGWPDSSCPVCPSDGMRIWSRSHGPTRVRSGW